MLYLLMKLIVLRSLSCKSNLSFIRCVPASHCQDSNVNMGWIHGTDLSRVSRVSGQLSCTGDFLQSLRRRHVLRLALQTLGGVMLPGLLSPFFSCRTDPPRGALGFLRYHMGWMILKMKSARAIGRASRTQKRVSFWMIGPVHPSRSYKP